MAGPSRTAPAGRPRVLTVVDWYLPGFKAGGPIRAIANLVERLSGSHEFLILTRDRDFGDGAAYPGIDTSRWWRSGSSSIRYLPPGSLSLRGLGGVLREHRYDAVYLNSVFSAFTWRLLLLRRLGRIPRVPMLIAPRGELAPSARWHKRGRKRLFLAMCRRIRLYSGLSWQASSPHEEAHIRAFLHGIGEPDPDVTLAPELPAAIPDRPLPRECKRADLLRAVFLSRVNRVKNLDGALRLLLDVPGEVRLDICGPIEDEAYWAECRAIISRLPPHVTVRHVGTFESAAIPALLAASDVLLLPSHGENYGHAIIEALAAGCPALVSDRTPWRGLADSGAGWDLPLVHEEGFRLAIADLVHMGEVEHARMRQAARDYARAVVADPSVLEANRRLFARLTAAVPDGWAA
jgi:glycosyltransferase involved in cell wall biosynthesis